MTLKELKNTVHSYLDTIWMMSNKKGKARTSMYKWLATQMNIPESKCHVRYFNRKQCEKAIKILKPKYIQLVGYDLNKAIKEELEKYMSKSPDVIHLVSTFELKDYLYNTDLDITYDNRPKIEDLDLFKRQLRSEVDNNTYRKLESFIDNYLKFYNK